MIKSLYFNNRFFLLLIAVIVIFVLGHFSPLLYAFGKVVLLTLLLFVLIDLLLLYNAPAKVVLASRKLPEKLSNGDDNAIFIEVKNDYNYAVDFNVIDEIPAQFQIRDFQIRFHLKSQQRKIIEYQLKPVERGEYNFGNINVFATNNIGLLRRRFIFKSEATVPVYPSFIQMRKYELMAISNRLTEMGVKKIRRIANNREFEQIREYVKGDDYRTINWKATARRNRYMVNQYQDEKSQPVYSIIDKGRTMKMPFEGMTLLDYAINASLIISNIAIYKQDKAGLLTFSKTMDTVLQASRKNNQMRNIMEQLYNQETGFLESNYELLYTTIKHRVRHRSLLLLFTNFEGLSSLNRQMPYFQKLSKSHLLVVIFFENTEISKMLDTSPQTLEEVYIKTTAEKYLYEKKQMVKELEKYGIHSILSKPENLNVNTINKYLELKAMGKI